jgi:hypothetical protein
VSAHCPGLFSFPAISPKNSKGTPTNYGKFSHHEKKSGAESVNRAVVVGANITF